MPASISTSLLKVTRTCSTSRCYSTRARPPPRRPTCSSRTRTASEVGLLASLESLALLLPDKYIVPHSRVHYLKGESSAEFIASRQAHHGSLEGP